MLIAARTRTYISRRLVVIAVILERNSVIRMAIFEIGFHIQRYLFLSHGSCSFFRFSRGRTCRPCLRGEFSSNPFASKPMFRGLNIILPEFASALVP
jgi:hypothetical protein